MGKFKKKYNKAILDTYQYNFLKAFGWFRSYYVNKLLDHIRSYLGCTECKDENYQNCLPIRDICKPIAVGSQDLTSDYDVNNKFNWLFCCRYCLFI